MLILTFLPPQVKCHRLVLSASCDYFSVMFTGNMRESKEVVVTINGVDDETLISIVNYCYTGMKLAVCLDCKK